MQSVRYTIILPGKLPRQVKNNFSTEKPAEPEKADVDVVVVSVTSQQQATQNQLNFVVSFLTKHPEFVHGHFRQCYAAEQALKEARIDRTEATKDKEFLHAGASTSSPQSRKRANDESRDEQAGNKTRGAKSSRRAK